MRVALPNAAVTKLQEAVVDPCFNLQIASDPIFGTKAGWSVAAGIQGRDIHTTYMMEGMREGSESRQD